MCTLSIRLLAHDSTSFSSMQEFNYKKDTPSKVEGNCISMKSSYDVQILFREFYLPACLHHLHIAKWRKCFELIPLLLGDLHFNISEIIKQISHLGE